MNDDSKVRGPGAADKAKITVAILLVLGGIAAFYVLGVEAGGIRWLAVVGALVLAIGLFIWSQYGRHFWQFVLDSRIELRKVVWPTRQETGQTTLVVFGFVILAGIFFWLLDLVLAWATRTLTGQGG